MVQKPSADRFTSLCLLLSAPADPDHVVVKVREEKIQVVFGKVTIQYLSCKADYFFSFVGHLIDMARPKLRRPSLLSPAAAGRREYLTPEGAVPEIFIYEAASSIQCQRIQDILLAVKLFLDVFYDIQIATVCQLTGKSVH